MNGMEMMLSRLIGMTPDQMRAQVNEALSLMKSGAQAMSDIQLRLQRIEQALNIEPISETQEETNNGGRAITNGRGRSNNHSIQL